MAYQTITRTLFRKLLSVKEILNQNDRCEGGRATLSGTEAAAFDSTTYRVVHSERAQWLFNRTKWKADARSDLFVECVELHIATPSRR